MVGICEENIVEHTKQEPVYLYVQRKSKTAICQGLAAVKERFGGSDDV